MSPRGPSLSPPLPAPSRLLRRSPDPDPDPEPGLDPCPGPLPRARARARARARSPSRLLLTSPSLEPDRLPRPPRGLPRRHLRPCVASSRLPQRRSRRRPWSVHRRRHPLPPHHGHRSPAARPRGHPPSARGVRDRDAPRSQHRSPARLTDARVPARARHRASDGVRRRLARDLAARRHRRLGVPVMPGMHSGSRRHRERRARPARHASRPPQHRPGPERGRSPRRLHRCSATSACGHRTSAGRGRHASPAARTSASPASRGAETPRQVAERHR